MTRTIMLGGLALLCAVITGCGGDDDDGTEPGPATTTGGSGGTGGAPGTGGSTPTGGTGGGGTGGGGGAGGGTTGGAAGSGTTVVAPNCAKFADPTEHCEAGSAIPNAFECDLSPQPGCVEQATAGIYCCPEPCAPLDQSVHGGRCTGDNPITYGCIGFVTVIEIPAVCTPDAGHPELICCPE